VRNRYAGKSEIRAEGMSKGGAVHHSIGGAGVGYPERGRTVGETWNAAVHAGSDVRHGVPLQARLPALEAVLGASRILTASDRDSLVVSDAASTTSL